MINPILEINNLVVSIGKKPKGANILDGISVQVHQGGAQADGFELIQPGLRLESGVEDGAVIGVHYDPMLAKLVAWAPSRVEAARLLAGTLAHARIHGVVTNRDLLVRVLRNPAFLGGAIDTGFLDRHPEVFAPLVSAMDTSKLSCLAAALASVAVRRGPFPAGWRNVPALPQAVGYEGPSGPIEVSYRFDRRGALAAWSVAGAA